MNNQNKYELFQIKKELGSIIAELDDIAYGVKRDFKGIGENKCSDSISRLSDYYRYVLKQLDRMNLSAYTMEFLVSQSDE